MIEAAENMVLRFRSFSTDRPGEDLSPIPPCQAACPLHMDIRKYVDLVAQGKSMEALQVIREGNPFPSICAYVCTSPCEDACRRRQVDGPIAIRALKKFAVEYGGDRGVRVEGTTSRPEKIAIVGSGPAGFSCAYYLRKLGYPVTIFEAHSELGGMLRVGIPSYRLPRNILNTEVERLQQMGVEIKTNCRVQSLDLLRKMGYKAVFVTIGAHQGLRMGIAGENGPGVIDGATFLREVNLGLKPCLGKRVAVVGGGNVAVDAARVARRLGADKVFIVYRRGREEMPAGEEEIRQALEEGVRLILRAAPTQIIRDNNKIIVICNRMELGEPDSSGRRRPSPQQGREFNLRIDNLITAVGQAPQVPGEFHLRSGRGSTIQVDPVTMLTNIRGVFAGGDAVTGPANVVSALAAGRLAATRIDDYLEHRYPLDKSIDGQGKGVVGELLPQTVERIRKQERIEPGLVPPDRRAKDFEPLEKVYTWAEATREARRCLHCGIGAWIISPDKCASCLTCLHACPYHVPCLDRYGSPHIPVDQCQACGICVSECPAKAIILREPHDWRYVSEQLERIIQPEGRGERKPLIIGFCCQYGLYGTGVLAGLWKSIPANTKIIPCLCAAKVEAEQVIEAFKKGAEGVFIAGCGDDCARENTAFWVYQRIKKVKRTLGQMGLEPERAAYFALGKPTPDLGREIEQFMEKIGRLYLDSAINEEVKG